MQNKMPMVSFVVITLHVLPGTSVTSINIDNNKKNIVTFGCLRQLKIIEMIDQ